MSATNYDFPGANQRVDELYAEYEGMAPDDSMLPADWIEANQDNTAVACVPCGQPTSYRIVERTTADDGSFSNEEYLFRIIGIIEEVDLPPFRQRVIRQTQASHIQQRVKITAPRASAHVKNVRAITRILDMAAKIAPLSTDTHACVTSIDGPVMFTNRMFTPVDHNRRQSPALITHAMDPLHALRRAAASKDLVHTEDNAVEYLARDQFGYKPTTPTFFHRGDIVEVHFSVVLFHAGQETLFAKLVLRSIANLDSSFSRAHRLLQFPSSPAGPTPMNDQVTLKRKRLGDHDCLKRQLAGNATNTQARQHGAGNPPDPAQIRSDRDATIPVHGPDIEMGESIRGVENNMKELALRQ